jgi:S1-C subfamily serine protease
VVRYNGVSIKDADQLYRMMLDSAPGSTAQVELLRAGTVHRLDVPVEQIDTAWRA